jgi:two-component system, OmpR family, sensor histidine kinase ChvG
MHYPQALSGGAPSGTRKRDMKLPVPFGLRGQLLLVSLILAAIPWVGYRYIWQVEKFLRQGQEKALAGTARALATALHERPQLFGPRDEASEETEGGTILYAPTLATPIVIDGDSTDWHGQLSRPMSFSESVDHRPAGEVAFSYVQRVGKYDQFLYADFEVTRGTQPVKAAAGGEDLRDRIEIALTSPRGELRRYLVTLAEAPYARTYKVAADETAGEEQVIQGEEHDIRGAWKRTPDGYSVELQLPLAFIGSKLGFALARQDGDSPHVVTLLGAPYSGQVSELPSIVIPGAEIDAILRGMGRTTSRIWVVDHLGRVLARAGSLRREDLAPEEVKRRAESWPSWMWSRIEAATLRQIYASILNRPSEDFEDDLDKAAMLTGTELEGAFNGALTTRWRLTPDSRAIVLSAAQPIWAGDRVTGAVVVEETTNEILALRNRALERLFNYALLAFLLGALALLFFASRISNRVRRLRDQAEEAIDSQGRVKGIIASSSDRDEIGDLSRSFSSVLQRLSEYTGYLEAMASRLSHEIRTPTAVVRSSLDNLRQQQLPEEAKVYVDRAQQGVERLTTILSRMAEATRLEHTMQSAEQERFDLCELIKGCVGGYQTAHPDKRFVVDTPAQPIVMLGVPDLIAQMLDKLASNAIDFSREGTPIAVRAAMGLTTAVINVENDGPPLAQEMRSQLFESLVSVRPQKGGEEPHLGLGLYVARLIAEFHRGSASLENRADGGGVIATVTLSMLGPEQRA